MYTTCIENIEIVVADRLAKKRNCEPMELPLNLLENWIDSTLQWLRLDKRMTEYEDKYFYCDDTDVEDIEKAYGIILVEMVVEEDWD